VLLLHHALPQIPLQERVREVRTPTDSLLRYFAIFDKLYCVDYSKLDNLTWIGYRLEEIENKIPGFGRVDSLDSSIFHSKYIEILNYTPVKL